MAVFFQQNALPRQQITLLPPAGDQTPRMVHHTMAGVLPVVRRVTEDFSNEPCVFFSANQPGNLPIGGDAPLWYLPDNRKYLINQIII